MFRDSAYPGPKVRGLAFGDSPPRNQKHLLRDLFTDHQVAGQRIRKGARERLIALDQLAERLAVARLGGSHELGFTGSLEPGTRLLRTRSDQSHFHVTRWSCLPDK
jgi:hypothetical protein